MGELDRRGDLTSEACRGRRLAPEVSERRLRYRVAPLRYVLVVRLI